MKTGVALTSQYSTLPTARVTLTYYIKDGV